MMLFIRYITACQSKLELKSTIENFGCSGIYSKYPCITLSKMEEKVINTPQQTLNPASSTPQDTLNQSPTRYIKYP